MSANAEPEITPECLSVFGPREGFTPQIALLVSQLNWMRSVLLGRLQTLSVEELDWLTNRNANTIGALLMHLAATDVYYRLNTFDGVAWGRFSYHVRKKWAVAMNLGETARVRFRGFDLAYYLSHLADTRQQTLHELRKKDDSWLMAIDTAWSWGPMNNLCKWFHVCEHESHHLGQIDLILKQLPGRLPLVKRSLEKGQASRTALGVALRRAAHQKYDESPRVLEDPIVVALLGSRYAAAVADEQVSLNEESSRQMRAWLVARSRFAEKLVLELVKRGVHVRFVKGSLTFTGEDSPMAHLLLRVIGAVAQCERDLIRERQREGIALAKQRKVYLGRVRSLSAAQAPGVANGRSSFIIAYKGSQFLL